MYFYYGFGEDLYKYLVSINLLFIVLVIGLTLFNTYLKGFKPFFPTEMKASMRGVSLYAIILSLFMFVYYNSIDSGFFDRKLDAFRYELENADYDALPDIDNPLKVLELSKVEFVEREMEKAQSFNTPFAWSTLTLIGIVVVGLAYSLGMVLIRIKLLPLIFR
ncbi:MAG: hypothetical protein DRI54_01170 [Bacteroidetes bacterium]|nr:MAG: hypothetical protein DRI54_01170 [Bacteroidota bacterium]